MKKSDSNINIFYDLDSFLWQTCSVIVGLITTLLAKLLRQLNHCTIVNDGLLYSILEDRSRARPMISISNHTSLGDIPLIVGKINKHKEHLPYKTGIGRLITEPDRLPVIIPMYFLGSDDILPMKRPYYPRIGKRVTILVGEPIQFSDRVTAAIESRPADKDTWTMIAEELHTCIDALQVKAEKIHET